MQKADANTDVLCAIFRKFNAGEGLQYSQVKSSAQRAIKQKLLAHYPYLNSGGLIDVLIPKKSQVIISKW